MSWLNWFKVEKRDSSYTDLLVGHLLSRATGTHSNPSGLAAMEIAASLYGRAFSLAEVEPMGPRTRGLTPNVLELIGRSLIRDGELVLSIAVGPDGVELLPASDWDVAGGPHPKTWRYNVNLAGPSITTTQLLPASGVIHARYACSPATPWRGMNPVQWASVTGAVGANVETRLAEELSSQVGQLLPVPGDPSDSRFDGLKSDLGALKGKAAMVPSLQGGWESGASSGGTRGDWKPVRFGADPPETLNDIRSGVGRQILAACGVPIAMADSGAQGPTLRESLRQFLHLSVAPLGNLVAAELSEKLETPVKLGFRRLYASDVQGRARAYGSLVKAEMDPERASRIAGLED